jgi:hypothetical protein
LEDLKVCGRAEMQKLLTLRHKYQATQKRVPKEDPAKKKDADAVEELDEEAKIEKELEEAMERIDREKKRAAKKEREIKQKFDLR